MTDTKTLTLAAQPTAAYTQRRVSYRTRGRRHGPIMRLMSPLDLGEVVKPFVFPGLFEAEWARCATLWPCTPIPALPRYWIHQA